jgi:glycosyltransferase involved in cell wall biosynthesis
MKIAMVGARGIPASYSGVEKSVEELAKRLAEKNHEILVYCRENNKHKQVHKNVNLVTLHTLKSKHFGTIIHVLLSTVHLLCKRIDIVHYHALGPSVFSFLPRIFGKKTVVTVHGLDWKRKKWNCIARFFLRFCEYPAVFFPNKTIVVSKTLKKYFETKYKKEVHYIPHGVEIIAKDISDKPEILRFGDDGYILFVGRLVPEKGLHYLIKAFNELDTDLKLCIVGVSSFTDNYVRYLKRIAGPGIQFMGFVQGDALEKLYRNAYLFVLPSEIEGLAISLLEAMSFGRCVLTSDIPECLEAIDHCGFSFKSKDYDDLNKQLKYLIDNPALVKEFGRKAAEFVIKTYNWDKVVKATEEIYLACVK